MMFLRLQNSRTENFAVRFVHFYHFMSSRDKEGLGTDFVVNIAEQVQKEYVFHPFLPFPL